MGNRVRLYIGVALAVLVAVNLVVLLFVGPQMSDVEEEVDLLPRDWEKSQEGPEDPWVIEDIEGPVPGSEPKKR